MAGKKTEKRLAAALLALLLVLALTPAAWAQVEQSESFYVADYANVLKADTEESIIQANALLEEHCQGAQIVVVTVDYLGGKYADDYAYELFNDWGVGSEEYNNGMLLLLATQEGKGWLAYGLGLTSQMDREADGLLERYFWDDFDRGDYDGAVNKLFAALLDWYGEEYGVSLSEGADLSYSGQGEVYGERRSGMSLGSIITVVVVIIILVNLFSRPRRRRYTGSGFGWGFGLGALLGSRRRTPPPPPGPMPPRGGRPFTPPPPGMGFRPTRSGRPGGFPGNFPGGRPGGGVGRGGRPGGGMGRGGGGFSGGGAGRR